MRLYAITDFSQGKINSTKRLHNDLHAILCICCKICISKTGICFIRNCICWNAWKDLKELKIISLFGGLNRMSPQLWHLTIYSPLCSSFGRQGRYGPVEESMSLGIGFEDFRSHGTKLKCPAEMRREHKTQMNPRRSLLRGLCAHKLGEMCGQKRRERKRGAFNF